MKAKDILESAVGHLKERGKTYDSKEGERSISRVIKCFNTITGNNITNEQGWLFMTLLKVVRSQQGEFKLDSYEDGAAYFALMGEEACNDKR